MALDRDPHNGHTAAMSRISRIGLVALLTATIAGAAMPAAALDRRGALASDWFGTVELNTDLPIQAGARVVFENADIGLRLVANVGLLPSPYVDLIQTVVTSVGNLEDEVATVLLEALTNSLVLRLHLGWRPFEEAGFYVDGGYTVMTLGGGVQGETLVSATGGSISESGAEREYDIDSTVHTLSLEIGYEWLFGDAWTFRLSLGAVTTIASSTSVTRSNTTGITDDVGRRAEVFLDDVYNAYVHTPVLGLGFGHRF